MPGGDFREVGATCSGSGQVAGAGSGWVDGPSGNMTYRSRRNYVKLWKWEKNY